MRKFSRNEQLQEVKATRELSKSIQNMGMVVEGTNHRQMRGRITIGTVHLDISLALCRISEELQYVAQLFT